MTTEAKGSGLDAYERLEKLGEGTYGIVYKAKLRANPSHVVALKQIKKDPNDEGFPATTIREISLLKVCQHPCIVQLEKSLCVKGEIWLVFEFIQNDLKKYLDSLDALLSAKRVKLLSYMLIEGVKFCHERSVLHRDLKPQNILISKDLHLKIADFGLAREHGLPINKLTHEVVTLWYRPPEILMGQERYSGACDMWGVGCIMAEMGARQALFPGDCEIDQLFQIFQLLGTPTEDIWSGVSSLPEYKVTFPSWKPKDLGKRLKNTFDNDGIKLLKQLLTYAPNKRITAKRALKSPWFDEIREIAVQKLAPFHREQQLLFQSTHQRQHQSTQLDMNGDNIGNNSSNQENINPNQNSRMRSSYSQRNKQEIPIAMETD